jgi:hypothetical protein
MIRSHDRVPDRFVLRVMRPYILKFRIHPEANQK